MKYVIANWKMEMDAHGGAAFVKELLRLCRGKDVLPEIVVCPNFLAMADLHKMLAHSRISLGAQDVFYEEVGAFTGEIGPGALKEAGCKYVLVGHSERRALGETDEMVSKKVCAVIHAGLFPVVCVGESEEVREHKGTDAYIREQIDRSLRGVQNHRAVLVAYEPLWAIGSGRTPDASETAELCSRIRSWASSPKAVLYGGSIDTENAYQFLREEAVDGVLVGGASVKISHFADIVQSALRAMRPSSV